MNFAAVEKIANAVLYEGYMLYPYRPSSTKNRQRWNFGTLYPQEYAVVQRPSEAYRMITECLLKADDGARLKLRVRFLQLCSGVGGAAETGIGNGQEGFERVADQQDLRLAELENQGKVFELDFEPAEVSGAVELRGRLAVKAEYLQDGLFKLHAELLNISHVEDAIRWERNEALRHSLVSAHILMGVEGGEFVSLLDVPEVLREAAAGCVNVGAFPVLVGDEGDRSMMLSSPIILYDYPQVAPESAGDFFDGTEMDEMLALRVLTLTDEEKREMRQAEGRTRAILERTEALPHDHLMKLHGAIRGLRRVRE